MTPEEIKASLKLARLTVSDIARACNVSPGHVQRVICGLSTSHPVQAVVSAAIGKAPEAVFPARYLPDDAREQQLRRLREVNEKVRLAS